MNHPLSFPPPSPTFNTRSATFLQNLLEHHEALQRQLARGLHSLVGQSLTAVGLGIESARVAANSEELKETLDLLRELTIQLGAEGRRLMSLLRPEALDDLGIEAAIRLLVRETREAGLACEFTSDSGTEGRLETSLETAIFRVTQESLQNVVQHARATQVFIHLVQQNDLVQLRVQDNGCGFDYPLALNNGEQNFGLQEIQFRVSLLHGRVGIESKVGAGTTLTAFFPRSLRSA